MTELSTKIRAGRPMIPGASNAETAVIARYTNVPRSAGNVSGTSTVRNVVSFPMPLVYAASSSAGSIARYAAESMK